MSGLSDFIKQVQQEVSTYPAWKRNLLRDSLISFNEDKKLMSDSDKMRQEFEAAANADNFFTLRTRGGEYINNEVAVAWRFYQLAYAAGRKAEQEIIRKLISWQVLAPLIKLSERVDEEIQRNHPERER